MNIKFEGLVASSLLCWACATSSGVREHVNEDGTVNASVPITLHVAKTATAAEAAHDEEPNALCNGDLKEHFKRFCAADPTAKVPLQLGDNCVAIDCPNHVLAIKWDCVIKTATKAGDGAIKRERVR